MHFSPLAITLMLLSPSSTIPILPSSSTATEAITRPLHLFSYAVDNHDFSLLPSVFTTDAICDFRDDKGVLRGLGNISAQLQRGLEGLVTHHALSTMLVEVEGCGGGGGQGGKGVQGWGVGGKARAESYLQGTFFVGGGKAVVTLGRYLDELRLTDEGWKVTNKTLIRTGQFESSAIRTKSFLPWR